MKLVLIILSALFLVTSCTKQLPNSLERLQSVQNLLDKNTKQVFISTQNFDLFSIQKASDKCTNINIYIEGDGLAWITRSRISKDPTPINPIGLKLMNVENSTCKIYIARPCQYINSSKNCENKYWTSHRFNNKIIESYNEALNLIKKQYQNESFSLIGYSGGAAVALLVSSKRDDISKVTTIAGNLDHTFWTSYHRINPLSGSLNPINYTLQLIKIPQYHLIGSNDSIIPREIFNSYISNFDDAINIKFKIYNATHAKNWEKNYRDFLKEIK